MCSTNLAWGGRKNLAPKWLSYSIFQNLSCFRTSILFQMLGQDGGMSGWAVGRVTAHLHGIQVFPSLVTSRYTS